MVPIYNNFAYIYDKLTLDIEYHKWTDYVEKLIKKNKISGTMVLELGCGTGSFGIEMAKRGYEMICLDLSGDMLDRASKKAAEEGADILFLNQDMSNFELYGTVDVIVCLLDSFNYLTRSVQVQRMLKLVHNYLNPNGLFIFDVNTKYKFENILSDNFFYEIGEDITYIWENEYNPKSGKARFDLTFFVREGQLFRRFEETHFERAYTHEELLGYIGEAGLELVSVYEGLTFKKPRNESPRNFYICKKGK
ncbi:glycine/sarcosine N-methyltransferase [Ruminiclostridium hungatei]|uniref:Glycine/sarcosine N-methyltransferase n=1 Tax=Ruminiclostridium hungatei TaxID=48256 RepID=A0A1V4SNN1_RUMHU|nr:class I SAM-dependent methyltransferase [Ruminiclostridium hungatei]OPX45482.1 glycine/sarcosine N-methyltransferase [Ruminiclostridium hungatei]